MTSSRSFIQQHNFGRCWMWSDLLSTIPLIPYFPLTVDLHHQWKNCFVLLPLNKAPFTLFFLFYIKSEEQDWATNARLLENTWISVMKPTCKGSFFSGHINLLTACCIPRSTSVHQIKTTTKIGFKILYKHKISHPLNCFQVCWKQQLSAVMLICCLNIRLNSLKMAKH